MHPEKEGKHLLKRFIEMWGYYTDGWLFSCTWDRSLGELGGWRLCAAHGDPHHDGSGGVRVHGVVDSQEWAGEHWSGSGRHFVAVDDVAEQMYLDSFKPENRFQGSEVLDDA